MQYNNNLVWFIFYMWKGKPRRHKIRHARTQTYIRFFKQVFPLNLESGFVNWILKRVCLFICLLCVSICVSYCMTLSYPLTLCWYVIRLFTFFFLFINFLFILFVIDNFCVHVNISLVKFLATFAYFGLNFPLLLIYTIRRFTRKIGVITILLSSVFHIIICDST